MVAAVKLGHVTVVSVLPPHPSGVEPEDNLWMCGGVQTARCLGLGVLAQLEDPIVLRILGEMEPRALAACCAVSDVLRAYASSEELWRAATLRLQNGAPLTSFHSSWKTTCLEAQRMRCSVSTQSPGTGTRALPRTRGVSVFSDTLYLSHKLTYSSSAFGAAPAGAPVERLERTAALDVAAFAREFEAGAGRPLVLEGAGSASVGSGAWEEEALCQKYGEQVFHAGGVDFTLR